MHRLSYVIALLFVAGAAGGCSNPADGKPKAAVTAPAPAPAAPVVRETLKLDPAKSKLTFIASKVTRSHTGGFGTFGGTIDLAGDNATASAITVDVDAASVTTDADDLTKHLKSPDFFDVAKYPKVTFRSTEIKRAEPGAERTHVVTGRLELHGVTKQITFPANIEVSEQGVIATSEFVINRKDFGIVYPGMPDDLIRDDVVVSFEIEAPRRPAHKS